MSDVREEARCASGDWVEIERVLLEPGERADGLPPDTAAQPLLMWVRGFARSDAAVGEPLEVETLAGRVATGTLGEIAPGYTHTFGPPVQGLVGVGPDLRARVDAYRAAEADGGAEQ